MALVQTYARVRKKKNHPKRNGFNGFKLLEMVPSKTEKAV